MDIHAEEINDEVVHVTCPHCGSGQTIKIALGSNSICENCQDDFEVEVRVEIVDVIGHKPTRMGRR